MVVYVLNLINLGTGHGTLVHHRKCLREWHSAPTSKETRLSSPYTLVDRSLVSSLQIGFLKKFHCRQWVTGVQWLSDDHILASCAQDGKVKVVKRPTFQFNNIGVLVN